MLYPPIGPVAIWRINSASAVPTELHELRGSWNGTVRSFGKKEEWMSDRWYLVCWWWLMRYNEISFWIQPIKLLILPEYAGFFTHKRCGFSHQSMVFFVTHPTTGILGMWRESLFDVTTKRCGFNEDTIDLPTPVGFEWIRWAFCLGGTWAKIDPTLARASVSARCYLAVCVNPLRPIGHAHVDQVW